MYDEYLSAIQLIVDAATDLPVVIGMLSPSAGFAVSPQGGARRQFKSGATLTLPLSLNAKAAKQVDALKAIGDVHAALLAATLPDVTRWKMTGLSIKSAPMYMGISDGAGGMHVFSSAIEARIYVRGDG